MLKRTLLKIIQNEKHFSRFELSERLKIGGHKIGIRKDIKGLYKG